jgi:alpha-D-ribose 1-methylphosphonate 5-triphosphate synthase subunit PhnI
MEAKTITLTFKDWEQLALAIAQVVEGSRYDREVGCQVVKAASIGDLQNAFRWAFSRAVPK